MRIKATLKYLKAETGNYQDRDWYKVTLFDNDDLYKFSTDNETYNKIKTLNNGDEIDANIELQNTRFGVKLTLLSFKSLV